MSETLFVDQDPDAAVDDDEVQSHRRRFRLPDVFYEVTLDRTVIATVVLASVTFFAVSVTISRQYPHYFEERLISSLISSKQVDPMKTGAAGAGEFDVPADAMPAPRIVRAKPLKPADFQIVMVYNNEAILSTDEELFRVRVGSEVPGLGKVSSIAPSETGGSVQTAEAMLRTVPN